MDVFDLQAKITLDSSEYESGLEKASGSASTFGSKLKGGLATAAKVGATAVAAVGAVGTAATAAFVKGASSVAVYGDNIDKMSQKMGLSASAYQEWDAVMQHSGTSMETMKASMKTLANAAETGSEAFEKLGISQQEIASMSQEELFEATISALQNVEDETQRTYLAGKTLGRGATELGALLNTSAEDTQKMRDRVHELGGVMSDDAVKASAAYQDSLQDMQTAISGIGRGIVGDMLPALTSVMDGITEVFAGDSDKGIGMISEGLDGLFDKIDEAIPKIIEVGGSIIEAFATALIDNLPQIMSNGAKIVASLGEGIINALPDLLASGMTLANDLVQTISDTLNEKFPAAGAAFDGFIEIASNAISFVQEFWAEHGEEIVSKAQEIWGNVKSAVSTAVETVQTIIQTVVSVIQVIWDTWGSDIIQIATMAWNLITTTITTAITEIQNIVTTVTSVISAIWDAWGSTIMAAAQVVWQGIQAVITVVLNVIKGLITAATAAIQGDWSGAWNAIQGVINTVWNAIVSAVSAAISAVFSVVSSILNAIRSVFVSVWNGIKSTVTSVVNGIKSTISSGIQGAYSAVSGTLESIRSKFSSVFNSAKSIVTSAISAIKGAFNFSWSLPHLNLPHISVTGGEAPFGIGGKGSLPQFSIDWYRKAMDDPYMLDGAMLFGMMGDKLLGGGEAGREIVVGEQRALDMIADASRSDELVNRVDRLIRLLEYYLPKQGNVQINGRAIDRMLGAMV